MFGKGAWVMNFYSFESKRDFVRSLKGQMAFDCGGGL